MPKNYKLPNLEENKQKFISLAKAHITRAGINELLKWLESTDFFTAPASTKFHCNYEGGLAEHSINVFNLAMMLSESCGVEVSRESIAIAALFHDICKVHYYKLDSRNVKDPQTNQWIKVPVWNVEDALPLGHGEKSCILLQMYMKPTLEELYAIRWHMAGYDSATKGGDWSGAAAMDKTPLCSLLQCSDMIATGLFEASKEQIAARSAR